MEILGGDHEVEIGILDRAEKADMIDDLLDLDLSESGIERSAQLEPRTLIVLDQQHADPVSFGLAPPNDRFAPLHAFPIRPD